MALSGVFSSDFGSNNGYTFQAEWSATQDISSNTSTVTARFYLISNGSGYTIGSNSSKTAYVTLDGTDSSFSYTASLSGNQKKLIGTASKTMPHNATGDKSFGLGASSNIGISGVASTISVSGSGTLNTIPRASTLTSGLSWTGGNNLTISVSRASSTFTHRAIISLAGWTLKSVDFESSTSTNFSVAENTDIFTRLYGVSSQPVAITLITYNGSTEIGRRSYTGGVCSQPIASFGNFATNFNIGVNVGGPIVSYNSAFTHIVNITRASDGMVLARGADFDSVFVDSYTFKGSDIASAFYAATPNSNTMDIHFHLATVYNGVQVGGSGRRYDARVNVVGSDPVFTGNLTYLDTNPATVAITENNQYVVQNNSVVEVTIPGNQKATARNSASMVNYVATLGGQSRTQTHTTGTSPIVFNFSSINASSDQILQVRAIDSRGNSTTLTKTVLIAPYSPPVVNATASRKFNFEDETTVTVKGSMSPINILGNKNRIVSVTTSYKLSTVSTYGSPLIDTTPVMNGNNYSIPDRVLPLDNQNAYDFEIRVTDRIATYVVTRRVESGIPIFFLDPAKKSVGVNKIPTDTGTFEINGVAHIEGSQELARFNTSENSGYATFYQNGARTGFVGFGSSTSASFGIRNDKTNTSVLVEENRVTINGADVMRSLEIQPTTPSFKNGWGSTLNVYYCKSYDGMVLLGGLLSPSGTKGVAAFTLPVGCRPPYERQFYCHGHNGTIIRVDIRVNGDVVVSSTEGSANSWISLQGVIFWTAQ